MAFVVAVTEPDWIENLSHMDLNGKTVNFWMPGKGGFSQSNYGKPIIFLRKGAAPRKIAGYAKIDYFERLKIQEAWSKFGQRNGVHSLDEFSNQLKKLRENANIETDGKIGSVELSDVVLFNSESWIDVDAVFDGSPGLAEFSSQIVRYKKYSGEVPDSILQGQPLSNRLKGGNTRTRFTSEEIVLCTYAAKYNEQDFGGLTVVGELQGRSIGSIKMKRNNIAAMMDEEGISRETTFSALSGMPEGTSGRRTNWDIVEPLCKLERAEFLALCVSITQGVEAPSDILSGEEFVEGATRIITSKRYERNQQARDACISHYGTSCMICKFNFEEIYGELGKGFIHVHHIKPISENEGEYVIDPIHDLIPVCPNCHSMIHRGNTTRDWEDIRDLIE